MKKQLTPKDVVESMTIETQLTLKEIINSNEPLSKLAQMPMTPIFGYKLSKTLKELDKVTEGFYKKRSELLDSMGTLNAKENKYEFPEGKEKEAEAQINLMLDEIVTINVAKISVAELGNVAIEPRIIAILDWLIIE